MEPGQYAVLMRECGFEVELLDASEKMLNEAGRLLSLEKVPPKRDIYDLIEGSEKMLKKYDLVFACAMMVHVLTGSVREILRAFHRMLKDGGVLFVNFKIGDHTLISYDGRFYEFYADAEPDSWMLHSTGFNILWENSTTNHKNIDGRNRGIRWVNFYCNRLPEVS